MGDILIIKASDREQFREESRLMDIFRACANQCASIHLSEGENGAMEVELWTPLYIDALTPKGLHDAMSSLNACREEIAKHCPFE